MNSVYFLLFNVCLMFNLLWHAECSVGNRERNPAMGLSNLLWTGEKYVYRTRKSELFYLLLAIEVEELSVIALILGNREAVWVV